jgi:hypothetical protein
MIVFLYFAVFLGFLLLDWKRLSGKRKERVIYLCLMAVAAAAGVILGVVPSNFGLVG